MKNTSSLRNRIDFSQIFKNNKFSAGKYIVLYCKTNNFIENRIGIIVSKKVGNSVKRNRVRRLIRENYRLLEDELKFGYDLIFVSRKNNNIPDFRAIQKEMKYVLKKLSMFK